MVITSVGSPAAVVPRLHAAGCRVFADVASLHHALRAIESGVDGLVLLTRAFTELPASFLRPSTERLGIDVATLDESVTVPEPRAARRLRTAVWAGPSRS